jgi:hypothetical protein
MLPVEDFPGALWRGDILLRAKTVKDSRLDRSEELARLGIIGIRIPGTFLQDFTSEKRIIPL